MNSSSQRLLPLFAAVTALGAGVALGTPSGHWLPAVHWHLVFAVGALPMILGAMGYFVPVLTRSEGMPPWLAVAPLTALIAGIGIVGFFLHGTPALRAASPWLALLAAAIFAAWLGLRWQRCLGHANPCIAWYAAALGLLAFGLLAVAAAPLWPEQTRALRVFHLHINTLGFMGVTALGTLQVLLPTVAGRIDPDAAARLTRDLKWTVGGALLLSLGAALATPLAYAGAVIYAWPLLRLLAHAWLSWRREILSAGGTLPLLAAALAGLGLVVGHGVLHAQGTAPGAAAIPLFIVAFLLPLVSGAAGHLLPVWLRPGIRTEWHQNCRRRLAYGARGRGVLLLAAGLLAAHGMVAGYVLGMLGALWLAASMFALSFSRPAR